MYALSAAGSMAWPEVVFYLGVLFVVAFLTGIVIASVFEARKMRVSASRADDMRQLVHRFEQLAENSLDAQQRVAADLAELRSRTASIEQILRTVE
jgi:hypothetical protein